MASQHQSKSESWTGWTACVYLREQPTVTAEDLSGVPIIWGDGSTGRHADDMVRVTLPGGGDVAVRGSLADHQALVTAWQGELQRIAFERDQAAEQAAEQAEVAG